VDWYFEIKKENSGPELHFYLHSHRSVNKLQLNPVFYTSIESGLINVFIIIYNILLIIIIIIIVVVIVIIVIIIRSNNSSCISITLQCDQKM